MLARLARGILRNLLRRNGYDIVAVDKKLDHDDYDLWAEDERLGIISRVRPYTMTTLARISALCRSVEYISAHRIPGDIVECGVWKGGSMMAAALRLAQLGDYERTLYLFDTFEGMPPPGPRDRDPRDRTAASMVDEENEKGGWCSCSLDEVKKALESTGYPQEKMVFVKGRVEETLPSAAPASIALLRLDTDWYESTLHELVHLYPLLSVGGVLILDDYGFWQGARQAVDEYLARHRLRLLLNRVDNSARICVKLDP
jgi:hypothetical protein